MNISYGIKNFRVFTTEGTTFNLKPITILTGANCAGKSSLVKSLLLLKNYFTSGAGVDYAPEKLPLSFSDGTIYINGIDKVLNNRSKGDRDVVFSVTRKGISENVVYRMDLSFSSKENDILNNGWLNRISFSCIIDEEPEVFLDVKVSPEGELDFQTFDLSGNVYRDFTRCLDIASYHRNFGDCSAEVRAGFFDDNYPKEEDLLRLNKAFDAMVADIMSNPLNGSMDFSVEPKYMWEFIDSKRYVRKLDIAAISNLKTVGVCFGPYKRFKKTGVLLYLPILDEIGGMKESELSAFFDGQREFDYRCLSCREQILLNPENHNGSIEVLMDAVIEAFRRSGKRTFNEYYKELEDKAIADIGTLSAKGYYFKDVPNWRNEFVAAHHLKDGGFVKAVESLMRMLEYLGDLEAYEDDYFSESILTRKDVDFYYVYRVLTYLERKRDVTDKIDYATEFAEHYHFNSSELINWNDPRYEDYIYYPESVIYAEYIKFIARTLSEFLHGRDFVGIISVGSFLCPVQRSYSIYDSDNPLSSLLLSYVNVKASLKKDALEKFKPGSFINKWVKAAGIGRAISIDLNDNQTAFCISIVDKSGKKRSSADYGHGVTQMLSILLNIEKLILLKYSGHKDPLTLCFEEPEVSLHPSWQSLLAGVFKDACDTYGIHFILETHSEYLTRATQAMVARECKTEEDLKMFPCIVYYMERNGSAYDLEYQLSGRFRRSFGSGFFDEASKSSLEILKRERELRNG